MKKFLYLVSVVLIIAGGLALVGANFASKTVHDQLSEQHIYFPATEADGLFPDLTKYAGQQVNNGTKAKVFADQYIKRHIEKSSSGQTYSEVSAAYLKNPTDQKLAQLRQTVFMGETLRGMLLNAWGWGMIGMITFYAGCGLVASGVLLAVGVAFKSQMGVKPKKKHTRSK
jgi:hypothetical protein